MSKHIEQQPNLKFVTGEGLNQSIKVIQNITNILNALSALSAIYVNKCLLNNLTLPLVDSGKLIRIALNLLLVLWLTIVVPNYTLDSNSIFMLNIPFLQNPSRDFNIT